MREYVIVPGHDPSRADLLARNLATQGIEVRRADEPMTLGGRAVCRPAPTSSRTRSRPAALIRNLLDPNTEQSAEFIKRQEERRKMRLNDRDLRHHRLEPADAVRRRGGDERHRRSASRRSAGAIAIRRADAAAQPFAAGKVGYLMPWGSAAAALSADALTQGIRISSVGGAFTLNGRRYPIGTAFIRNAGNPADLNARSPRSPPSTAPSSCRSIPRGSTKGMSLGSNESRALKTPKVLLAWDTPTQTLSAGWTRYTLERRFGRRHGGPHVVARPRQLQRLRRDRPAVGKLRRRDQRCACSTASRIGCAAAARWSRWRRRRAGRPARTSGSSTRSRC